MKRLLIALFLTIAEFAASAYAQTEKAIGENYLTGDSIMVKEYVFPERIYDYRVDTSSNRLFVYLRERNRKGNRWTEAGRVVSYDLSDHTVKWTKAITYTEQKLLHAGDFMTVSNYNYQPSCLNRNTGEVKCTLEGRIFYLDGEMNLGLGMNDVLNKIRCIDMHTGNVVWEKRLDGAYGINDVNMLSDSTILVSAAGLHLFNLGHGGGWDYKAKTGIKDYTEAAVASALGVVTAAVMGVGILAYGYNLLHDLASNTLIDGGLIYFADMNRLSCFETDGTVKWYKEFDKNVLSKSHLSLKGDTLIMVNLGYGHYNGKPLPHGFPFIAAYDRHTGNELFMCKIGVEDYPVKDFFFKDNSVAVLFGDKTGEYSITDGTYICDKYFSDLGCGELTGFVSRFTFMHYGGVYTPLWEAYPDKTCMLNNEKVYVLDGKMNVTDEIEYKNLYRLYWINSRYRFMANDRETVVTDSDGIEVARFECSSDAFVAGHFLYEIKDNILREIDISAFPPYSNDHRKTQATVSDEIGCMQEAECI